MRLVRIIGRRAYWVGAPHLISNIRPVIYDAKATVDTGGDTSHPYSLEEFKSDIHSTSGLDAFNHHFLDQRMFSFECPILPHPFTSVKSNQRYQKAESRILAALPANCPQDEKEAAIGAFRRNWLIRETPLQKAYNWELRRRTWQEIFASLGAKWLKLR